MLGLMELVIRLAVRIAIIKHRRMPVTQAHVTGLNVATVACQHRIDRRQRRLWRHALGQLFLH